MTGIPMTRLAPARAEALPAPPHLAVQILGLVFFSGFAIVSTTLAFVHFWPAGFALALAFGWFGFGQLLSRSPIWRPTRRSSIQTPERDVPARHGNTRFDAYRADILARLEDEQDSFLRFLDRLREAKDRTEFDAFMDDRARANTARDTDRPTGDAPSPAAGA